MANTKIKTTIFEDASGNRFFHFSDLGIVLYPAEKKGENLKIIVGIKDDELHSYIKITDAEMSGGFVDAVLKINQAHSVLRKMNDLITLPLSGLGGLLGKILG